MPSVPACSTCCGLKEVLLLLLSLRLHLLLLAVWTCKTDGVCLSCRSRQHRVRLSLLLSTPRVEVMHRVYQVWQVTLWLLLVCSGWVGFGSFRL